MKGIKLGILAICVALAGLCAATNHFYAYIGGGLAVVLALIAYFGKEK